MQSRYPYKPSKNELAALQQKFLGYLMNYASDDGLSLSASVAVNKPISEVIPTLGNDVIPAVYQINTCYNTYAHDGAFCCIN